MKELLKILLAISLLFAIASCYENKIEEFQLVSGDIKHGLGSIFTFVDDLDNNAHSEVIFVSNDDKQTHQFNNRIYIFDFDSYSAIHSEVILTELKDVKAYVANNDGMKEIIYTYQNEDLLFFKVVKEYIKLTKILISSN